MAVKLPVRKDENVEVPEVVEKKQLESTPQKALPQVAERYTFTFEETAENKFLVGEFYSHTFYQFYTSMQPDIPICGYFGNPSKFDPILAKDKVTDRWIEIQNGNSLFPNFYVPGVSNLPGEGHLRIKASQIIGIERMHVKWVFLDNDPLDMDGKLTLILDGPRDSADPSQFYEKHFHVDFPKCKIVVSSKAFVCVSSTDEQGNRRREFGYIQGTQQTKDKSSILRMTAVRFKKNVLTECVSYVKVSDVTSINRAEVSFIPYE